MFFFEHLLERISKCKYKDAIILKGGLLLSSIIGDDNRTTKDMDATIKGIKLSRKNIIDVLETILTVDIRDNISYEIESINDIRLQAEYDGYRVNILAKMEKLKFHLQLEFTTGDIITPREIEYGFNSMFEKKKIYIMSYTIETIVAEKFEAFISRSTSNTRLKDYYDLYKLDISKLNEETLFKSIHNTFRQRETNFDIYYIKKIFGNIRNSNELKSRWLSYQDNTPYARNISYEGIMLSIEKIIVTLEKQFIGV